MNSELTYDLRSGEADSLDQMVAITFANIAVDLIGEGEQGRMMAIVDGKYAHVPIPEPGPAQGRRRHDVRPGRASGRNTTTDVGMPLLLGSHAVGAKAFA